MLERIKTELLKRIKNMTTQDIEITMKNSGDKINISLFNGKYECYFQSIGEIRYFKNINELSLFILDYEKNMKQWENELKKEHEEGARMVFKFYNDNLKGHKKSEIDSYTLSFFSDIYKSVYDVRPHEILKREVF